MRKCPVAMVFTLRSVLPMVAHSVGPANASSLSETGAPARQLPEQMLLQHNARHVTVTEPRARTSCYPERRSEISLYSWHVNHADPITGAMSTCKRGTGRTQGSP